MSSADFAQDVEVAVDTGGTFTDLVCRVGSGEIHHAKIPSTPEDPARAIEAAIDHIVETWRIDTGRISRFVHGTTVGTNAVLERKGATMALITTAGFRDTLELGRFNRSDEDLYNPAPKANTPAFLVSRELRMEADERIGSDGSVVRSLDESRLRETLKLLAQEGVEAVAICLLFSFLRPEHEARIEELVREYLPAAAISRSSVVDPAHREYERTVVTCFDAYIKPILGGYLERAEASLARKGVKCPLQVIHSRGGVTNAAVARERPGRLFLSGPAGGVIGGSFLAEDAGIDDAITVDIGGTSSDIALIRKGKPLVASAGLIDGYSVRLSMVDVNAIGAGGGSIAWLDRMGGLHVGPQSAGADPGPACYGRGGKQATVTDASIVLGYINPEAFAGGSIRIDPDKAFDAIESQIARPMGITVRDAALGIHRVVNAHMAEGIRFVSVKRGLDPRKFTLIPLGGGGGVHAFPIAQALKISSILLPPLPGVMSAVGMLAAPIEYERSCGCPGPLASTTPDSIRHILGGLDSECRELLDGEVLPDGPHEVTHAAELCFVGQSHYLEVVFDSGEADPRQGMARRFRELHEQIFGHVSDGPVQLVSLRTIHRIPYGRKRGASYPKGTVSPRSGRTRKIYLDGNSGEIEAAVVERHSLQAGSLIEGPAIVQQIDTTTVIPQGWKGMTRPDGEILFVAEHEYARDHNAA